MKPSIVFITSFKLTKMKIGISGLGLIGGSIALQLTKANPECTIMGYDTSKQHQKKACEAGLVDQLLNHKDELLEADLIILAMPVNAILKMLPYYLDRISNQVITDTGSLKHELCEAVANHPRRKNYVAGHPMAGTEHSGPDAAKSDLYRDRYWILSEVDKSGESALEGMIKIISLLKAHILYIDPVKHDEQMAYLSHLSHLSSFALATTINKAEKNGNGHISHLAGGGLYSTIRLANSSSSMWTPIFNMNSNNMINCIDNFIDNLNTLKDQIKNRDHDALTQQIKKANKIYGKIYNEKNQK